MTVRLQTEPFDPAAEAAILTQGRIDIGAVVTFTGLCRGIEPDAGAGAPVLGAMTLEHYPGMAEEEIERHVAEAERRWPLLGVTVIHRYGRLVPGDPIVLVVTASAHRQAAFEAAEFLMDYLKTQAPFWKCEEIADGARWVESKASDDQATERWKRSSTTDQWAPQQLGRMQPLRIHIMGASGSGTTTLSCALATRLSIPHHDTDDYYWLPTNPPFQQKRPAGERLRLMRDVFCARPDWVLSGALGGWGAELVPLFDLVIFLHAPTSVRLSRLRARESARFGSEAIGPGGVRHQTAEDFFSWAGGYDEGKQPGRSLAAHEAWLAKLTCPVLRLDTAPVDALIAQALEVTRRLRPHRHQAAE